MKGSWAGAMGQLQFMPSTFIDYAMDGDGDGRKDIWGSPADAIESAANYMAAAWRPGYIWGRQVALPGDFDPSTAGLDAERPLAEWSALGVRRIDGTALPAVGRERRDRAPQRRAWTPAFLVYQNYRAILIDGTAPICSRSRSVTSRTGSADNPRSRASGPARGACSCIAAAWRWPPRRTAWPSAAR